MTRFWRDESGATAIEYALVAGFIMVTIVAAVRTLGTNLGNHFAPIAANLS